MRWWQYLSYSICIEFADSQLVLVVGRLLLVVEGLVVVGRLLQVVEGLVVVGRLLPVVEGLVVVVGRLLQIVEGLVIVGRLLQVVEGLGPPFDDIILGWRGSSRSFDVD